MRQLSILFMLFCLFAIPVIAQDIAPVPTEDPLSTGEAIEGEDIETPAESVATPFGDSFQILIDTRADLELLAATRLQSPVRPEGWNGSLDVNNPQLPLLIRLDLELLAGTTLGLDQRPAGWFGAVPSTESAFIRDIRHDTELLADTFFGFNNRPEGWIGGPPLFRCNRATQALVNMLQRGGVFTLTIDPSAPDYCAQAEVEASRFSEVNLLGNTSGAIFTSSVQASLPGAITIQTNFAVAFLDKNANLRVGVIPNGTVVTPQARSTSPFSKMVLVSGDGFAVFIEFPNTNLSEEQFRSLPDSDQAPIEPFCAASWCGAG